MPWPIASLYWNSYTSKRDGLTFEPILKLGSLNIIIIMRHTTAFYYQNDNVSSVIPTVLLLFQLLQILFRSLLVSRSRKALHTQVYIVCILIRLVDIPACITCHYASSFLFSEQRKFNDESYCWHLIDICMQSIRLWEFYNQWH